MHISRPLTIKQMAMVTAVVLVLVSIFCTILLFHLVQQSRYNTATQLESIAHSVREPLSSTILKGDIPKTEAILASTRPAGVISRTDVVPPNQFQALRENFIPERPVPIMVTRLFKLLVQISLGVYSLERPANPRSITYLVLQADSFRMYKFVMSTLPTLVTICLLLSLIPTVAISWCINRLILHPLRNIARELNAIPAKEFVGHQLALSRLHQGDEIGMLIHSYNLNQQLLQRHYEGQNESTMRFPVSDPPSRALLMEMLEQVIVRKQTTALMIVTCEILRDTTGVLKEAQQEIPLLTLMEELKSVPPPRMTLAQIDDCDFAVIVNGIRKPWHIVALDQQVLTIISERLPIGRVQLRSHCSIGVAIFYGGLTAEQLYSRAISATFTTHHKSRNQTQFFDPQQMKAAQKRLTEGSGTLNALENHQFTIWLQPQVEITSSKLISAEMLLRVQQPDGSWDLPGGLIDHVKCRGLMVTIGHRALEGSCRLLAAWQKRGIMLPLSVSLSTLQLVHPDMVAGILELLTRYRIRSGALTLEVTRNRRTDDPHATVTILRLLHNTGIRVALDDFGMGYAGLRQLQHMKSLPIDALKIDKMFVEGLPEDSSMIATIIMPAQSLNLQMIAEGVETEAQRDWLAKAGVGITQNFLFARPLPIEIFEGSYLEEK